jgi:hypothetical protein
VGWGEEESLAAETRSAAGWEAKVASVIRSYWRTHFNDHLFANMSDQSSVHPNLASLATWERASRTDPSFILHCNWRFARQLKDIDFSDR